MDRLKFLEKSIKIHGEKYDYTKTVVENVHTKATITCPIHGDFEQKPVKHYGGQGCNKCSTKKAVNIIVDKASNSFKEKANIKHENKYLYTKVDYVNAKEFVTITCPIHGDFEQKPYHHLQGSGCQECGKDSSEKAKKVDVSHYLSLWNIVHNSKYTYDKVKYIASDIKVIVTCKEHGDFLVTPGNHREGKGCPDCGSWYSEFQNEQAKNNFIPKASIIHNNKFDYSKVNYINAVTDIEIICPNHGSFFQTPGRHIYNKNGCSKCTDTVSKPEIELQEFLRQHVEIETNNRKILNGKELDVYIPSKNLAIEFNGLYWHSELFKDKNYHLNKTELSSSKGIKLIHIFEDEWLYKKEIVKSRLLNFLGKTENKIYARKCTVALVSSVEASKFLNENHIQGNVSTALKIGLYSNNELVSLMTFGKPRISLGGVTKEGNYELVRFCNKLNTNVIGAASKLLKHFEITYFPKEIISYADKRWSTGDLYQTLNFNLIHSTPPNYFYTKGIVREGRFGYRKDRLVAQGFDKNSTEREIMINRNYFRIYDCGVLTFKKNYN